MAVTAHSWPKYFENKSCVQYKVGRMTLYHSAHACESNIDNILGTPA